MFIVALVICLLIVGLRLMMLVLMVVDYLLDSRMFGGWVLSLKWVVIVLL